MALYTIAETVSGFWGGFMFDGLGLGTQGSSGVMAVVAAAVTVRVRVGHSGSCVNAELMCKSPPLRQLLIGSAVAAIDSWGPLTDGIVSAGRLQPNRRGVLASDNSGEPALHALSTHRHRERVQAAWSVHAWRAWRRISATSASGGGAAAYERVATQDEEAV